MQRLERKLVGPSGPKLPARGSGDDIVSSAQECAAARKGGNEYSEFVVKITNGNSVFDLRLDAAQQAQFDATLIAAGCTIGVACNNVFEGLSASFGTGLPGQVCPGAGTVGGLPSPGGCFASTDGQESFLAFQAVPGPIVGAGLPGLIASLAGMVGLNRYRKRRRVA